MIVYNSCKADFLQDVLSGRIEEIIRDKVKTSLNQNTGQSEIDSWQNSLMYMNMILGDRGIPEDVGIAIEMQIPQTNKRIDFIITGQNDKRIDHAIIVELKGWKTAELTEKDGIIKTQFKGRMTETTHPSYQAWTYASLLNYFNETVYTENIQLKPCAYLHNYDGDAIANEFYDEHLKKAPTFLKGDAVALQNFIKEYVKYGDKGELVYRIDKGKIKPSKMLADSLSSMIAGNEEFFMIDDQKVVYESAMSFVKKATAKTKRVLIVEGGPGTGKSVVAINLLVNITRLKKFATYVTKNAAPRDVYQHKLTGQVSKTYISTMFKGSGAFVNTPSNAFDSLIVDEAHRLNEKSGLYGNLGENQIKEIIRASKSSVFFIDEDQRVTLKDIGSKEEIMKWARHVGAEIEVLKLASQFRCNGSDGYLAWLDNVLQIRETANESLDGLNYDFKIFSSPVELREQIEKLNEKNNKARMVAGYCWDWNSNKNPKLSDVRIPEYGFEMTWNLKLDGNLWIMNKNSVKEIGCIHTCQGLEVDYVGVIVGPDFIVRDGKVMTLPEKRSKMDRTILGYKRMMKESPEETGEMLDRIIKNTYRTLMTRGMKGCYVYFTDKETERFFRVKME